MGTVLWCNMLFLHSLKAERSKCRGVSAWTESFDFMKMFVLRWNSNDEHLFYCRQRWTLGMNWLESATNFMIAKGANDCHSPFPHILKARFFLGPIISPHPCPFPVLWVTGRLKIMRLWPIKFVWVSIFKLNTGLGIHLCYRYTRPRSALFFLTWCTF